MDKIVLVEWMDHASPSDNEAWHKIETVKQLTPCHCVSLGKVVQETDQFLTVVSSYQLDSNEVSGIVAIVKSAIVKIRVIPAVE